MLDFASETEGSKRTDREFVIVDGNISNDIDIPVKIPYMLKAPFCVIPEIFSILGIKMDSKL